MVDPQSFQILRITSHSDHPVRSSSGEFIFGNHILWEGDAARDGDHGSSAPNVFAYNFTSPLASNSTLNVTIRAVNPEAFGTDILLQGLLGGSKVFESRDFTIRSVEEVDIAVCVVEPYSSAEPGSLNGDFTWAMVSKEQHQSGRKFEYTSPDKTRLELYWVSPDIHEIFLAGLSGIDVEFLRCSIPSLRFDFKMHVSDPQSNVRAAFQALPPWARVTQQTFSAYSKVYDTVAGRPRFGVGFNGGHFQYRYYIQARPGGRPGSLQPIVNCYDQAAMVQVLASTSAVNVRPTWLYQNPNGWINPTFLVGVPQLCNNPFFRSNNSPQHIGVNDQRRTGFGNHVFNGHVQRWHPNNNENRIYDACGGPHLGTHDPVRYLNSTIDRVTTLYGINGLRPGTVTDVRQYPGVTATFAALAHPGDRKMSETTEKLLQKCTVSNAKSRSQIHWDDVPQWVKTVLGDSCDIAFQETNIGNGVVEALWHLTGTDVAGGEVTVRVRVETRNGEDGNLDYERSSRAAFDDLAVTLEDVELDLGPNQEILDALWAPAPFENYAQYALQYAVDIPEGRILIVCGNSMIDICGGSSSATLEPLLQKLLMHTTLDAPFSLHIPDVTQCSYEIPEIGSGFSNEVKGILSSFTVKCDVDDMIAAASADVEGFGLLLSRCDINGNEASKTSTVTFTFVTRAVGTHEIDLRFAEALTMNTSTKRIQVTVVDA